MKDYGKIKSLEKPERIDIRANTVFVASNITPYTEIVEEDYVIQGYEYNYKSYNKDEYIHELEDQILNTQLALCDIYESLGGDSL